MIGEPLAVEGAFLDLGDALVEGLAHFVCHQTRELVLASAQDFGGFTNDGTALLERGPTPFAEGVMSGRSRLVALLDRVLLVGSARFARCRIDRLQLLPRRRSSEFSLIGHRESPSRSGIQASGPRTNCAPDVTTIS